MTTASSLSAASARPRTVVLVEGASDRCALEALAHRRGRDLTAEGVAVVDIGGATNIRRALAQYGPGGLDVGLAGLCDLAEEHVFRRALQGADLLPDSSVVDSLTELESAGFFVCVPDLEGELIRAAGIVAVTEILAAERDLASFRLLQRQPAQRGRSVEDQLHRFMGTRSGRKAHYARLLVEAVDLQRVPRPLDAVLVHADPAGG